MDITKKLKLTEQQMDNLFDFSGNISVKYYELQDDKKYFMVLRISDKYEKAIKKARNYKNLMTINADGNGKKYLKEALETKIKEIKEKSKKEIDNIKNIQSSFCSLTIKTPEL